MSVPTSTDFSNVVSQTNLCLFLPSRNPSQFKILQLSRTDKRQIENLCKYSRADSLSCQIASSVFGLRPHLIQRVSTEQKAPALVSARRQSFYSKPGFLPHMPPLSTSFRCTEGEGDFGWGYIEREIYIKKCMAYLLLFSNLWVRVVWFLSKKAGWVGSGGIMLWWFHSYLTDSRRWSWGLLSTTRTFVLWDPTESHFIPHQHEATGRCHPGI